MGLRGQGDVQRARLEDRCSSADEGQPSHQCSGCHPGATPGALSDSHGAAASAHGGIAAGDEGEGRSGALRPATLVQVGIGEAQKVGDPGGGIGGGRHPPTEGWRASVHPLEECRDVGCARSGQHGDEFVAADPVQGVASSQVRCE
jgi:hypothetical protein